MFAAGAHAFLRRGGTEIVALLEAEEGVLELVHACVGKEQRGVVGRNQRRRMDYLMILRFEVGEELVANLRSCEHAL